LELGSADVVEAVSECREVVAEILGLLGIDLAGVHELVDRPVE